MSNTDYKVSEIGLIEADLHNAINIALLMSEEIGSNAPLSEFSEKVKHDKSYAWCARADYVASFSSALIVLLSEIEKELHSVTEHVEILISEHKI